MDDGIRIRDGGASGQLAGKQPDIGDGWRGHMAVEPAWAQVLGPTDKRLPSRSADRVLLVPASSILLAPYPGALPWGATGTKGRGATGKTAQGSPLAL